jgi:hypothetical protein
VEQAQPPLVAQTSTENPPAAGELVPGQPTGDAPSALAPSQEVPAAPPPIALPVAPDPEPTARAPGRRVERKSSVPKARPTQASSAAPRAAATDSWSTPTRWSTPALAGPSFEKRGSAQTAEVGQDWATPLQPNPYQ